MNPHDLTHLKESYVEMRMDMKQGYGQHSFEVDEYRETMLNDCIAFIFDNTCKATHYYLNNKHGEFLKSVFKLTNTRIRGTRAIELITRATRYELGVVHGYIECSGSSRIAADKHNLPFTGIELDSDYFYAHCKRFDNYTAQQTLF
jgi:hypothetical protein